MGGPGLQVPILHCVIQRITNRITPPAIPPATQKLTTCYHLPHNLLYNLLHNLPTPATPPTTTCHTTCHTTCYTTCYSTCRSCSWSSSANCFLCAGLMYFLPSKTASSCLVCSPVNRTCPPLLRDPLPAPPVSWYAAPAHTTNSLDYDTVIAH